MNTTLVCVLGMLGTLILLCYGLTFMTTWYSREERWKFFMVLLIVCFFLELLPILTLIQKQRDEDLRMQDQATSTIPQFGTLSNGVYSVLGTYRGPDRKWLAILRNTTITSIDRTNKVVVATVKDNEYPILVVTGEPIAGPQYEKIIAFTGFAEIGINQTNKFIRDYNPFRMSKK
jgi:hypothetical protein